MKRQFSVLVLLAITLGWGGTSTSLANSSAEGQVQPLILGQGSELTAIDISKISIGKVKLGMSLKRVAQVLGRPRQRIKENSACLGDLTTLKYQKLDVVILDGRVFSISTKNRVYGTKEGVRVGDSISKAKAVYRQFQMEENAEGAVSYVSDNYGGLVFNTKKGVITAITAVASSC